MNRVSVHPESAGQYLHDVRMQDMARMKVGHSCSKEEEKKNNLSTSASRTDVCE